MVGYDDDTVKENTPIGTGLNAIDLPDNTTITIQANEATILGKYENTLFSETHMEHNGANFKRIENGL